MSTWEQRPRVGSRSFPRVSSDTPTGYTRSVHFSERHSPRLHQAQRDKGDSALVVNKRGGSRERLRDVDPVASRSCRWGLPPQGCNVANRPTQPRNLPNQRTALISVEGHSAHSHMEDLFEGYASTAILSVFYGWPARQQTLATMPPALRGDSRQRDKAVRFCICCHTGPADFPVRGQNALWPISDCPPHCTGAWNVLTSRKQLSQKVTRESKLKIGNTKRKQPSPDHFLQDWVKQRNARRGNGRWSC